MRHRGIKQVSISLLIFMLLGMVAGCSGSDSADDLITDDRVTLAAEFAPYTVVPDQKT
jgi:hypothetical protein